MEAFLSFDGIISLLTLTLMEVVLGIDNIIFISIICDRVQVDQQKKARFIGLGLALGVRIVLLLCISWIVGLKEPLFATNLDFTSLGSKHIIELAFTGRDLILIFGGLFLLFKSVSEIHHNLEGKEEDKDKNKAGKAFSAVILQIVLIDIVFSFDSILTAVGLVDHVEIMIAAVLISMGIMLAASGKISKFINDHPSIKMLALSFLLMIAVLLVAEGFNQHIEKGYIYFSMFFALIVEVLNMRTRKKSNSVKLKKRISE